MRGDDNDPIDISDPAVARHYDELPLWSAPFGKLILDRVPMRTGQTMLDIGSGTGFLSVELAQRCGRNSRVFAVDPWAQALDVLRDRLTHLGLSNVEVIEADAAATGLPEASIDVAVSNLGVNNFTDPAAVLTECRRVLRPGGRLIFTSNLVGHMAEFYEVFAETLSSLGLDDRLPALRADVEHRATVPGAQATLEAAGFEVTQIVEDSLVMRFADGAALWGHYFMRLGFVPQWQDVMGPGNVKSVSAELVRRLDVRAAAQNGLTLTVPMACLDATVRAPSVRSGERAVAR